MKKKENSDGFCPMKRRTFLKGIAATAAVCSLPGLKLQPDAHAATKFDAGMKTYRNACPRNCYDTCSIVTKVKDGVIQYIEGAPESSFTDGALCVKGFSYPRRVYSPDRIKYPMRQVGGRGSGKWVRMSWSEAIDRIASKMIEIRKKDDSMLGLALDKYSGNFGITHYGVEGMMSSLGYTTRFVGTPCWPAGIDAQNYDMGNMWCNDPEDFVNSKYIIAWGANPAWNSVHSMKFLYEAQEKGAKLVVIDPVMTQTAAKADQYIQIKTGADGALALGMAKYILDNDMVDEDFVNNYSVGFDEFKQYLSTITIEWAAKESGVPAEMIETLAKEFATTDPATIWIGYGLQRHVNGGASVRAIDAVVAMTGNIGKSGGGARYGHLQTWGFNYHALVQKKPEGAKGFLGAAGPKGEFDFGKEQKASYTDRAININKLAEGLLNTNEPPIRMLWVACKNPMSQDFDKPKLIKAFQKPEMIIVVDQFYNQTVEYADIVLPHTTLFEEYTVNVSYWHYWLGINEQAIKPMYEAKTDIEIAALLSERLNAQVPGFCTFPTKVDTKEWTEKEFNKGIYDFFGIKSWKELRNGPVKAKIKPASWSDKKFGTPSGKYEFKSETAEKNGQKALPEYKARRDAYAPYRLLTPHSKYGIHSQFQNIDYMEEFNNEPVVYINPALAKEKDINDGDMVLVYNKVGREKLKVQITDNVAPDVLLIYEAWFNKKKFNVQNLVDDESSDMGAFKTGAPGVAIHDQFADLMKA